MKKWQLIAFGVVIALLCLILAKDFVIQTTIARVGSQVVGAPLEVGKFSWGLLNQKFRIKNMRLYNPPGFPSEIMLDVPEIGVDYDLGALFKGRLHLPLVIFHLKEMVVIKTKEGKLNVDSLKVAEAEKAKKEEEEAKREGKAMPMQIDVMKLNVGRVIMKDFSEGDQPTILVYDVDLKDKTFHDITSPQQLAALVMVQAMSQTAIKGAKIYAAATLLGVGFLPAGIAGAFLGRDDFEQGFRANFSKVYQVSLDLIRNTGELKNESRDTGTIKGNVNGYDVTIQVLGQAAGNTQVKVSARKMMLPKPEFAGGILYQIAQRLK